MGGLLIRSAGSADLGVWKQARLDGGRGEKAVTMMNAKPLWQRVRYQDSHVHGEFLPNAVNSCRPLGRVPTVWGEAEGFPNDETQAPDATFFLSK